MKKKPSDELAAPADGRAVIVLCAVQFLDVLGVTVVVSALPKMLESVNASPSSGSLVATGYAMFFGGLLMFGARLGDRIGHRRVILLSLVASAAGAVLAAASASVVVLTAARCVQGGAAATAVPSALRLLTTVTAEGVARQWAVAAWSAAGAAAGASGFVVGGVVTDLTSWRVIFWAYLPLSALLAAAVLRSVPSDRDRDPTRSLNVISAALLTAAVMAIVVGTTVLARPGERLLGTVLLGLAIALAPAFGAVDRRSGSPLLPGALLRQPAVRQGALGALLNTAATSSVATLATLYLQNTLHRSPLTAAAALLPFSVAVIVGSSLAAPLLRRAPPQRVAAAGLAVIAGGDAVLILVASHIPALSACIAAAGFGIGLSSVATTTLGTSVARQSRGTASGVINTTAQLGTAIGIAILVLVATATTGAPAADTARPAIAWAVAAVLAAGGATAFALSRPTATETKQ
ncbi:MAG: MFS transporter [Solirubrobacteraceae bacterium]